MFEKHVKRAKASLKELILLTLVMLEAVQNFLPHKTAIRRATFSSLLVAAAAWIVFLAFCSRGVESFIAATTTKQSQFSSLSFSTCCSSLSSRLFAQRQRRSVFDKADGILYRTSVFNSTELETISSEVRTYLKHLQEETSSSIAQNRLGAVLPTDSKTVQILRHGSLQRLVQTTAVATTSSHSSFSSQQQHNNNLFPPADDEDCYQLSVHVPVEIRSYERVGAGMTWHVDDALYDNPPQIEFVWTLENTSDCQTLWKSSSSSSSSDKKNGAIQSIETEPNAVLLLRAGENGPSHCVTSLQRGRRIILKGAFAATRATFREQDLAKQFGSGKKKKTKMTRR